MLLEIQNLHAKVEGREILRGMMATRPHLRCIAMTNTPRGKGNGQSAAFHAGFRACRAPLIAVLDAAP